jgi:regulator of sigma D
LNKFLINLLTISGDSKHFSFYIKMSHKKERNERNKTMKETKIIPKIVDTTIRCNGKRQRTHFA